MRRRRPLIAFCLLAALLLAPPLPGETDPLTNVDVVRMVMSGLTDEAIIDRITTTPTAFEVDPGIVRELREAGVSQAVIDVMSSLTPGGTGPPPVAEPEPENGFLELLFETDPKKDAASNSIAAPVLSRPLLVEEGTLVEGKGDPEPVALAFVITCSAAPHVPDHWTDKSRIGRIVGRHRQVFFHEETLKLEGQNRFVYLGHPPSWTIPMEPGVHQGHLGGAARVGEDGEFFELFVTPYKELEIAPGETTTMKIRLSSPGPKRRERRGFLRSASASTRPGSMLGDPRLRPRIRILETGHPGGDEAPAPPEEGDGADRD